MDFQLSFHGAAQNVTGSRYLLSANGQNLLVDCGLYQEHNLKERNWRDFPFPPDKLNAVLLTHAHLDHCGLLPRLVKAGFKGPVYCTAPTADIARIVLLDCARINEEDAEFKRRRHEQEGRTPKYKELPLYTEEEAREVFPLLTPCKYNEKIDLGGGLAVEFCEIGHILGASFLRVFVSQKGATRTIVFSGDVGRKQMPILRDPAPIGEADYLVLESTYGNRIHSPQQDIPKALATIINQTCERGGNLIIPSFAIERTQDLLYFLSLLHSQDMIPRLPIFVDSPMAVKVSMIFKRYPDLYDRETKELARAFRGANTSLIHTQADSKAINHIRGTAIIIAGSGMCTGGRIKHHLTHNIEDIANTILYDGYQASNTMGLHNKDCAPID
ncbi:MAG: MBL fold metallo-hydrolase, partial [Victivallales bacterium]|nr:MBL fold metallo-hydrolase [Victivallales bacterium]